MCRDHFKTHFLTSWLSDLFPDKTTLKACHIPLWDHVTFYTGIEPYECFGLTTWVRQGSMTAKEKKEDCDDFYVKGMKGVQVWMAGCILAAETRGLQQNMTDKESRNNLACVVQWVLYRSVLSEGRVAEAQWKELSELLSCSDRGESRAGTYPNFYSAVTRSTMPLNSPVSCGWRDTVN